MKMRNLFSMSAKYREMYPGVGFGLTLITGCQDASNPSGFDQYKRKLLRKMRKRETLAQITERIEIYNRFFQGFGFDCPLPKHLNRTVNSGFPRYSLYVDAHFMAEMCAGILVAVTDFKKFEGNLILDVTDENEIVCVLCQGADEKTRVGEKTTDVLFYAYAVPSIAGQYLKEGLTIAADTLVEFGGGNVEFIDLF